MFCRGFLCVKIKPKGYLAFLCQYSLQFVDLSKAYAPQFITLAITFSVLVAFIHTVYDVFASLAKAKLLSGRGNGNLNCWQRLDWIWYWVGNIK